MKILFLLIIFIFSGCAVKPASHIVKEQKPDVLVVEQDYDKVHRLLSDKIIKCYKQKKGKYHLMGEGDAEQKTITKFDPLKKEGAIYYQYKTEFEREIIFYVQVNSRGPASTEVKVYGQGKGLRTRKELKKNLQKWFKGKKAYCIGRGNF